MPERDPRESQEWVEWKRLVTEYANGNCECGEIGTTDDPRWEPTFERSETVRRELDAFVLRLLRERGRRPEWYGALDRGRIEQVYKTPGSPRTLYPGKPLYALVPVTGGEG